MRRRSTKGKCGYCSKLLSGSGMTRHLQTCKARESSFQEELSTPGVITSHNPIFLLKVSSGPLYWLFMEVDGSATLESLDSFLRNIWLECCGHLSCFTINGIRYDSHPSNDLFFKVKSKSMKTKLVSVLTPELSFEHEYDFGTTTYLDLKVISVRQGERMKDPIHLISRNDPPSFECSSCKKKATSICSECIWNVGYKGSVFCDNCLPKHECGEDMALPVVNSPRMGMCGYTG